MNFGKRKSQIHNKPLLMFHQKRRFKKFIERNQANHEY